MKFGCQKRVTTLPSYLIVVLVALCYPQSSTSLYKNICRLFADDVKLRDPYACNAYLTCQNATGISIECPKGQIYSTEKSKCVISPKGCLDPCKPDLTNIWLADPQSCNGYYYCENGHGKFGICPDELHFNAARQQCIYSQNSECLIDNYCHIVPAKVNFKNERFCDKYYVCEGGTLKSKSCPTKELYSRVEGKCMDETKVRKCDSVPSDICKDGKTIVKNKFVPDRVTCRGYYYCADKGPLADENPNWSQCPGGLFFNNKAQACRDSTSVICSADRCDGQSDGFITSQTSCQHYLICRNGVTVDEGKCPDQKFFNEILGGCTSTVIQNEICS